MGNRAVLDFKNGQGVYLHWNGGRESVEAFLRAAKDLGIRSNKSDPEYCVARFAQMVGNYFGGTTSLGVAPITSLDCDNGDNGVFEINGWEIKGFRHTPEWAKSSIFENPDPEKTEAIYQEVMAVNQPIFATN